MNTEKLITELRHLIADNSTLTLDKVFTPDLPKDVLNGVAISLLGGNATNNLCKSVEYFNLVGRVLIRGNENDLETRKIVDSVFNTLHLLEHSFDDGNIIMTTCELPVFVGKDENNINVYNITFNMKIE